MIHSIIMQVLQTIPTKPPKHFLGGKTKRQFARPRNRTKYLYDGVDLIAEYNGSTVVRRYVHGPGLDEPLVEYQGTGTSNRTFLIADERGSIVAGSNSSGTKTYINTYDEFGRPGSGNQGLFQYTGQVYLSSVDLYHYKARTYDPETGRFLQADPIGYAAGMNMYSYVGNDPMNLVDPFGLEPDPFCDDVCRQEQREAWERRIAHAERIFGRERVPWNPGLGRGNGPGAPPDGRGSGLGMPTSGGSGYNDTVSAAGAPDVQSDNRQGSLQANGLPATEDRTWGSYLPGTEAGANAAEYWANIAVNSEHPLARLAHVPGLFAALWTEDTAVQTTATLAGAYLLRVFGPFSTRGLPSGIQRGRKYIRFDRPHHNKGWEFDGTIPQWLRDLWK